MKREKEVEVVPPCVILSLRLNELNNVEALICQTFLQH